MTVLFVVMEFVPMNIAGVYRPLRFINGLQANGIHTVVVTFAIDENLKKFPLKIDEDLAKELDPEVTVIRIAMDDLHSFSNTSWKKFWYTYANPVENYLNAWKKNLYKEIPGIIEKYKPQLIITTCPPFSSALLARNLSKQYALPLILDMRDAWSQGGISPAGSRLHYLRKKYLEGTAFKQASAIITVTPQLLNAFKKIHPEIPGEKFHLIYNTSSGKLDANFKVESPSIVKKEIINIGYTGYFYYDPLARQLVLTPWWKKKGHRKLQYTPVSEDWLYRSPFFFLKALNALLNKRTEWKNKIKFHYIGEIPDWLQAMVNEFELSENVVLHGYQIHQKVLELEKGFDLLLSTSEKVIGSEHSSLPSKLFTYLKAGKPIVGFVTNGIQKEFIQNCGVGIICDPDNTANCVKVLENILTNGFTGQMNPFYLAQFTNDKAIQKLIEIVESSVN